MIPILFFIQSKGEKRMAKVTLTIKENNTKESVQFEIDRITTFQALKLKTEIGAVLKELKANGELTGILENLVKGQADAVEGEEMEVLKDQRFVNGMAGAFDQLLDTVPDRAVNILAILSGIDRSIIEKLYVEELMDVYDAVMQENDLMKLVTRMKKSFLGTKNQWGEMISQMFTKK